MATADAKRQEERVKLVASALSNAGVAAIVSGAIAPMIIGRFNNWIALGGFMFGLGLHLAAQVVLHYVVADDVDETEGER